MSLVKCPECEKDISVEIKICPHCGWPVKTENIGGSRVNLKFLVCRVLQAIKNGEKLTHQDCGISLEEYGAVLEMIGGRYATDVEVLRGGVAYPVKEANIESAQINAGGLTYLGENCEKK